MVDIGFRVNEGSIILQDTKRMNSTVSEGDWGSLGGAQDGEDHDLLQPLVHVATSDCEDVDAVRIFLCRQC